MRPEILTILRCPTCAGELTLGRSSFPGEQVEAGTLSCSQGHCYPIRAGIPRFVPQSNYANNFGMQWNKFRQTQLDSYSGHPISEQRFWQATGWRPEQIRGQWVLDAGCGAGRFAEVALRAGAKLIALDYSSAVDACWANLRQHPNLHVVQGDIYALPFVRAFFPFVYSLGVLQHTPDVARAFRSLLPLVGPRGRVAVDFYEKSWRSWLHPKYWLRPVTKRLPQDRLFAALEVLVPRMLAVSRGLSAIPLLGRGLSRFVPVVNYVGVLPLDEKQQREWSLLDTFDWLAPAFDNPQTAATLVGWARECGLQQAEVTRAGHLVLRGVVAAG